MDDIRSTSFESLFIFINLIQTPFYKDLSIGSANTHDDSENWDSVDVLTSIGGRACYERYCPPPHGCSGTIERDAAAAAYNLGWDAKWTGMK